MTTTASEQSSRPPHGRSPSDARRPMSARRARMIALAVAADAVAEEGEWLLYRDYDVARADQAGVKKQIKQVAQELEAQSDALLRTIAQEDPDALAP